MAQDRRARRGPHPQDRDQRQFLVDGRDRAVRAVLGDFLRPWRPYSGRPAGQPGRGRRPLRRDLESGLHAVRPAAAGRARSAAQAERRHRDGAGTHHGPHAGHQRQLRDRCAQDADRGVGRPVRHGRGRRARGGAPGDRRSPARVELPDRRRRAAVERGKGLRAAAHHAACDAPRPHHGRAGAPAVEARGDAGRRHGRRVPRDRARRGADHRDAAPRGDPVQGDARTRPSGCSPTRPARLGESKKLPGEVAFRLYDTYGFPLDLTEDVLRGEGRGVDFRGVRGSDGTPARGGEKELGGLRPGPPRDEIWFDLRERVGATEFLGYTTLAAGRRRGRADRGRQARRARRGGKRGLGHRQPDPVLRRGGAARSATSGCWKARTERRWRSRTRGTTPKT